LPKLKTGKEIYPFWVDLFNYLKFILNDDQADEEPIRSDCFNIERLKQHGESLAKAQLVTNNPNKGYNLSRRLLDNKTVLYENYNHINEAIKQEQAITPAAEWLIDNFHIIEEQLKDIQIHLPIGFYKELPKLSNSSHLKGYPRVYGLAWNFIAHLDSRFEPESLIQFSNAYQSIQALSIGEIWAIAISLRTVLIENLRRLSVLIVNSSQARKAADLIADALLSTDKEKIKKAESFLEHISSEPLRDSFLVQLLQRLHYQDPAVTPALKSINQRLIDLNLTIDELVSREHNRQSASNLSVRNIITSMRAISTFNWRDFFEAVSITNRILSKDSSFTVIDFATQDQYLHAIEALARNSKHTEISIAKRIISKIEALKLLDSSSERELDIGFYLISRGKKTVEKEISFKAPIFEKLKKFYISNAKIGYSCTILIFSGLIVFFSFLINEESTVPIWALWAFAISSFFPASDIVITLVNKIVSMTVGPQHLPLIKFESGVPSSLSTFVVMPVLLINTKTIEEQLQQLEIHYLSNPEGQVHFAILSDWKDSNYKINTADCDLLKIAKSGIEKLNKQYGSLADEQKRFFIFHRKQIWNASEGKWMGWERKRVKLHEFNQLLRGSEDTTYIVTKEELAEIPRNIKYVITLDADTRMPMQSVEQLVGIIAHPLNKAHLNEELRIVTEGYGILRPCVLASLPSRHNTSIFQRLFSGPCGMDPYTFTSSDVYQDLFGEASYTGKGIYDLDIFEAVLKDRIPENSLLSHDLFEGIFARCGFISDLNLFEDFPSNTEVAASRLHRWTRGDWQLVPWIFGNRDKTISFIGLWKMLDNLRRSLSAPAMILILALAWFIPQAPHLYWIIFIITAIGLPLFLPFISGFFAYPFRNQLNRTRADLHYEFLLSLGQTLCTIALLLHSALQMIDAITRTLFRLFISKRKLLQWVSASQEQISSNLSPLYFFTKHRVSVIIAAYAGILITISNIDLLTKAIASPFIIAWVLSPAIAYFISLPPKADPTESLTQDESKKLRLIARHTWRFFTTFVTKEDNFLPPDNFQETPSPTIAHRSSPTNFGLYLLSILAAKDFGWIGKKEMLNKLEQTLEVLKELPRHRGHFFNWYETTSKQPLHPHYISSVDSGNLAAYLLVVAQACEELEETAISIENRVAGIQDAIELLKESLAKLRDKRRTSIVDLDQLKSGIKHLEKLLVDGAEWQVVQSMAHTLMDISETLIQELGKADSVEILFWTREVYETIKSHIADSQETSNDLKTLSEKTINIINSTQKLFTEMDFKFLFDDHRKLFYIGFNASENIFDNSFYDMLASEARLTSFVTIAKGEISVKHWFLLSRALTAIGHTAALLSWSGSIFEYLMPSLVMYTPSKSLLDNTCRSIIKRQIEYGKEQDVPWGISESAYNIRDINLTYQYSSFGVPGLGLKRGIGQNLVISPYSTALAAMYYPKLALENFEALAKLDALGKYGFYEAIDFTASRIPESKKLAIVQNYMAHHQGMSIIALGNVIFKGNMRHRFHNIPEIRAAELLLQERTPHTITTIEPFVDQIEIDNVRNLAQPLIRRFKLPSHSIPETLLLSNGHYSVMFNSAGSGYSKWKDIAVTRWREDATCDRHGSYIFLRDIDTKQSWSLGYQPSATKPSNYEANFTEDMARIFREDGDISSYLELIVSNEDDTEIKRITIKNNGLRTKEIEITSYSEIVLAPQATDLMHPAFSNLFIETEYLAKTNTLIASRRPRSSKEKAVWLAHLIAIENNTKSSVVEYETDRSRFLGRTHSIRNAISITAGQALSNTVGAVLDPIASLRTRIIIPAGASLEVCFATMVSDSREELITRIDKYCDTSIFERAAALAWTHSQAKLHYLGIDESEANLFQQMASHLIYVNSAMRPSSNLLKRNTLNVSGLWTHKISGDHPILLAYINSVDDQPLVKQLLRAHEYWRLKRFAVDLIFINEKNTSYVQDLQILLESMIRTNMKALDEDNHILNYGSVYAIRADLLNPAEKNLFNTVARMIISSEEGTLSEQLRRINLGSHKLIHEPKIHTNININTQRNWSLNAPPLEYFNGLGGFTDDGKEYAVVLNKLQSTPAPWINIIANDQIGFLVSESGSSYTWSLNSRENQITAWSNDAVSDPSGEAFYIVDEDTQEIWTPTALPIRIENTTYIARHGRGYSSFEHFSHDIESKLTQYVSNSASIKISRLVLKNHSPKSRNLSITAYVEWVLGSSRSSNAPFIITEIDEDTGAVFAHNPWNRDFSERISFTDFHGMKTSYTTDRKEFIGRNGTLSKPAALSKGQHLSGNHGAGLDPCSAQSQRIELEANQSIELVFFLGQAEDKETASKLITEYRNTDLDYILNEVKQNWNKILGKIQVKTPDRASDLMLNGWLLYQSLSCRYLARTAFYQASGAFGFRDQLQDVMALTISRPDITKAQILNAAKHQFLAGDVQHWWHPPSDKGVRTKCSDDLVWLPYAVHHYIKTTGDSSILEEEIPFLEGPELSSLDESIYFEPIHLKQTASLFKHCKKALDKSLKTGSHGLPLIGSCDWSDGLNMVGEKGLGESVWVGWFLYLNLINFSTLIKDLNINYDTSTWLKHAKFLQESLESAWDGEWYTRAFFDDGTPLGSKLNDECKIDCLAQSWSVISKAADKSRASLAMDSVEKYLIKHTDKMMLLFTPPFNKTALDPGYIKGYLPGIRENGGQYTHGVVWNIIAYAMLGNAKKAHECFSMLNPINHSNTRLGAHKYKLEPYVMAGDVYSEAPHTGRGGWSWYTGSAAWMYRAGIEWILGLTVENNILKLNPCIPDYWDGFTIYYQHESSSYEITVHNKQTSLKHVLETDTQNIVSSERRTIELDGEIIIGDGVPLVNDGVKHLVKLELSSKDLA
jgi:cyclic beta-1,2-glucan synthetase